MDRELSPAELEDLLAAYAIDAVDDEERRAIEDHLAHDPDARAHVNALQHAASFLAHSGGPPPPGVWERLEATIEESQPHDAPAPPRLVPAARRVPRPNRVWQWVAVAASVAAIVFGALWLTTDDGGSGNNLAASAAAADHAPGARHARLVDSGGTTVARAVVLPDGSGYLTSTLPGLAPGRTYQLWGIDDNATISLGVMGRHPGVVAFHAGRPAKLAVTEERRGGVAVTANTPTAVGNLA